MSGIAGDGIVKAVVEPQPILAGVLAETPGEDVDAWMDRVVAQFDDRKRTNGFLPLAEQALQTFPGYPPLYLLAATAALLDARTDRAQLYLKRYSKRAESICAYLLQGLTLNQAGQHAAARALLQRWGLLDLTWPTAPSRQGARATAGWRSNSGHFSSRGASWSPAKRVAALVLLRRKRSEVRRPVRQRVLLAAPRLHRRRQPRSPSPPKSRCRRCRRSRSKFRSPSR